MVRLRRLCHYRGQSNFADYLSYINKIRGEYQWSVKTYDDSNCKNVYVICSFQEAIGFLDAELCGTDLCDSKRVQVFVNDLHLAKSRQRSGVGQSIIRHFLDKGLDVEFVIANCNSKAVALVAKFSHEKKYVTDATTTVFIRAGSNISSHAA